MKSTHRFLQAFAAAAGLALVLLAPPVHAQLSGKDVVMRNDAKCTKCHDDPQLLTIGQTKHGVQADGRTPSCTNCHGPSENHLAKSENKPDVVFAGSHKDDADKMSGQCLTCHESGNRTLWHGSRHQNEKVACSNCHTTHAPRDKTLFKATQFETCYGCHKTERAQGLRISHHPVQEGKVACSDCHQPHGSTGNKLLQKTTVNETCWQCHAEKRGPFLWEHASVTDDCMNCHTPHGSTNPPLLRARQPYLCQECHGDGAPHPGNVYSASSLPGGAVTNVNNTGGVSGSNQLGVTNPVTGARVTQNNPPAQLAYRGCVNCHSMIHGSNHPAGNRFLR